MVVGIAPGGVTQQHFLLVGGFIRHIHLCCGSGLDHCSDYLEVIFQAGWQKKQDVKVTVSCII